MSTHLLPEHPDWLWRTPDPKPSYDAIIVGGGGHGIAYAWLPAELATPGQTVHIGYFDRRIPATVRSEPLFDAGMQRLRS